MSMLPKMTKGWGLYEFAVLDDGTTKDFLTEFDRLKDAWNTRIDRMRELKSAKRKGRHILSILENDGHGRAVYFREDIVVESGPQISSSKGEWK